MRFKKCLLASIFSCVIFNYSYADSAIPEQPQLSLPINSNSGSDSANSQPDSANTDTQQTNAQNAPDTTTSNFKEGSDYKRITPAITADSTNTIQIINFFSYNCRGCYDLEKTLDDWSNDMPYYVKVVNSPVATDIKYAYPVRVYFALDKIGAKSVSMALFKESAEGKIDVTDYKTYPKLKAWLTNRQININDFEAAFDSGEVLSKVSAAPSIVKQYNLDSLPSISIDGKYLIDARMLMETKNPENTKKLISYLVNKASKEKMKSRREEE